jgi:hypothetical protein
VNLRRRLEHAQHGGRCLPFSPNNCPTTQGDTKHDRQREIKEAKGRNTELWSVGANRFSPLQVVNNLTFHRDYSYEALWGRVHITRYSIMPGWLNSIQLSAAISRFSTQNSTIRTNKEGNVTKERGNWIIIHWDKAHYCWFFRCKPRFEQKPDDYRIHQFGKKIAFLNCNRKPAVFHYRTNVRRMKSYRKYPNASSGRLKKSIHGLEIWT